MASSGNTPKGLRESTRSRGSRRSRRSRRSRGSRGSRGSRESIAQIAVIVPRDIYNPKLKDTKLGVKTKPANKLDTLPNPDDKPKRKGKDRMSKKKS